MDGITLSFTDARPVLAPGALEEQVRAAAPLLAEAAAGVWASLSRSIVLLI